MVDSEGFLGRLKRTTKLINGRVEPPHIHEAGPHRTPGDKGTRMILPQGLPTAIQHRLILDQGLAGPPHGTKLPRIFIANQQGIWVIFARDLHANRKKLFSLGQCLSDTTHLIKANHHLGPSKERVGIMGAKNMTLLFKHIHKFRERLGKSAKLGKTIGSLIPQIQNRHIRFSVCLFESICAFTE